MSELRVNRMMVVLTSCPSNVSIFHLLRNDELASTFRTLQNLGLRRVDFLLGFLNLCTFLRGLLE